MLPSSLDKLALYWPLGEPCLVRYLGRIESDEQTEAMVSNGVSRVAVPHETVFCFGSVCQTGAAFCHLVMTVGNA